MSAEISVYLQCEFCEQTASVREVNTFAYCDICKGSPWMTRYPAKSTWRKEEINEHDHSMWRYAQMLPELHKDSIVTLGEGWTPITSLEHLKGKYSLSHLWLKDEARNPTGSFKARGMSMAVSKAKDLGISTCIVPTAGNAGGALSAYCAKGGLNAIVVMPTHTPDAFKKECRLYGAQVIEVEGLINKCGAFVKDFRKHTPCFDMSTMREPYRLEGKKTLGYEIAEQFNWQLPDAILYPTGGGTGLIGMWKAFQEMRELGWVTSPMPKMIAVQAANCQPICDALTDDDGNEFARTYKGRPTIANGLAVPEPFAMRHILHIIKASKGTVVAVEENQIRSAVDEIARKEGLLICPEGGALLPALKQLIEARYLHKSDRILLLNTGSAYKYFDNL